MNLQFFRRIFYEIHLWLGIISGVILFVVCLSGTILVFQDEVRRIAMPERYYVKVSEGQTPLPIDELIAKVEAVKPTMKVGNVTIPEQSNRTVTMNLVSPNQGGASQGSRNGRGGGDSSGPQGGGRGGGGGGGRGSNMLFVNPYTAEILGEGVNVVDPFFVSMMKLHRFLWMDTTIGRPVVGWATVIFIVMCLSGLVLWFPRTWSSLKKWQAWRIGFRIRFRKGVWPLVYDLHNTLGFYFLIPCLIMALTGLCWSFAWYRDTASNLFGEQVFKGRHFQAEKIEPPDETMIPLSVGEMIARQNELTPDPGEITVTIPHDKETALSIQKGGTGFFSLDIKDRTQWDRFRGTVVPVELYGKTVEVERFGDKPFGAKIVTAVRGLHLGNITGMSSKILFFFACLFATSFPITGVTLWINKLRRKSNRRKPVKEESEQDNETAGTNPSEN